MNFDSKNLYSTYAKYAAVLGLVASLGASISFNPESKLVAREDYNKTVHQMALAQAVPPSAKTSDKAQTSKKTKAKPTAKQEAPAQVDPKPVTSAQPDPNFNLELAPGSRKTIPLAHARLDYSMATDGTFLLKCTPICDTCDSDTIAKATQSGSFSSHNMRIIFDLDTIAKSDKDRGDAMKACMDGAILDKGNKKTADTTKDPKTRDKSDDSDDNSFELADFPPADKDTQCDVSLVKGLDLSSSGTWESRDFSNLKKVSTCFLKEQITACETKGMNDDALEKYSHKAKSGGWPSSAARQRCGTLVEKFYTDNLKKVIDDGLGLNSFGDTSTDANAHHGKAMELIQSLLGFTPSRYVTTALDAELTAKVRASDINMANSYLTAQTQYISDNYKCEDLPMSIGPNNQPNADRTLCETTRTLAYRKALGNTTNLMQGIVNTDMAVTATSARIAPAYLGLFKNLYAVPMSKSISMVRDLSLKPDPNSVQASNLTAMQTLLSSLGQTGTADGSGLKIGTATDGTPIFAPTFGAPISGVDYNALMAQANQPATTTVTQPSNTTAATTVAAPGSRPSVLNQIRRQDGTTPPLPTGIVPPAQPQGGSGRVSSGSLTN